MLVVNNGLLSEKVRQRCRKALGSMLEKPPYSRLLQAIHNWTLNCMDAAWNEDKRLSMDGEAAIAESIMRSSMVREELEQQVDLLNNEVPKQCKGVALTSRGLVPSLWRSGWCG